MGKEGRGRQVPGLRNEGIGGKMHCESEVEFKCKRTDELLAILCWLAIFFLQLFVLLRCDVDVSDCVFVSVSVGDCDLFSGEFLFLRGAIIKILLFSYSVNEKLLRRHTSKHPTPC